MASIFTEIKPSGPDADSSELAELLDTKLQALGPIGILDLQLEKRTLFKNPLLLFTLNAEVPGPLSFRAQYFTDPSHQWAPNQLDQQYNNFFAADLTRRAFYLFDVSTELRRSINREAIIVIYSTSAASNFGMNTERVVVIQANENIPAGGSGEASIVSTTGLLDTITIRNQSDAPWVANNRGYASLSNTDASIWDAYQICCNI